MKLLKTIKDKDLGLDFEDPIVYEERRGARAIVFDKDNNIALLHATKKYYHKLPGGGVEEGEDLITALKREAVEEIGCEITNIRELGIIEEFRNKISQHQLSYCYVADLVGEKGVTHMEEGEIADGFEPVWMSLDNAIEILENENNISDYLGKFIRTRDLCFLKEIRRII